jgi:hypothetical protein
MVYRPDHLLTAQGRNAIGSSAGSATPVHRTAFTSSVLSAATCGNLGGDLAMNRSA